MQPGASTSLSHSTRVYVMASAASGTSLSPPAAVGPPAAPAGPPSPRAALAVQVTGPSSAIVGRPIVFDVAYTNQGNKRLTGLVLHAILSEGLRHPVGQNIEADLPDLEPGVTKTVKINVNAVGPGRQGIQVRLGGPGIPEVTSQAAIEIAPASTSLTVQMPPATRLLAGRTTDLRIDVANHSAKPLRHVSLVGYLPEGIDFVAASDHGLFQPSGRSVSWLLDPLGPGQAQSLVLRVQARGAGQGSFPITAKADGVAEVKAASSLSVEGTVDLAVDLVADNAVEVGREAIYEVRIANPGSGPNTNVRVELTFAPGLTPRAGQGPTGCRVGGQSVVFEPLSSLAAQGQTVYRVAATGQVAGDPHVRVSVISDQVRTPATRERGVHVYRD
jgi:hypothetical protein